MARRSLFTIGFRESAILETFTEADVQVPEWKYQTVAQELSNCPVYGACGLWKALLRYIVPDSVSWAHGRIYPLKVPNNYGEQVATTAFVIENPASAQDCSHSVTFVKAPAVYVSMAGRLPLLWAVPYCCPIGQYLRPGEYSEMV